MKVLIASNSTLIRSGIQFILNDTAQLISSFSFENADKFIKAVANENPDILFFDKDNSEVLNLSTLLEVKLKYPLIKIVVITETDPVIDLLHCAELGIESCLTYSCDKDEIRDALRKLLKNERFYCPKITAKIIEGQQLRTHHGCKAVNLTERETEIAKLIAEGNTNKIIAELLCISPHTVHTHRKSLMKKLGVNSAAEVARFAVNRGLIA